MSKAHPYLKQTKNLILRRATIMPNTGNMIKFKHGTAAQYAAATKSADTIYFLTDTKQIFVGEVEYTEAAFILNEQPVNGTTEGVPGKLYVYNGNMYMCDSSKNWTKVANVNEKNGTVTSVTVGEGLETGSGDANPITNAGTVKHAVPEGAAAHTDSGADATPEFGGTFKIQTVETDKFGHVVGIKEHTITLPEESEETAISITPATAEAKTLVAGERFTVVTEVEKGDGSHEVKRTITEFTLPEDKNTTYTLAQGATDGSVKLVSTDGTEVHGDIVIAGWDQVAKKSDIAAVLIFKGNVDEVADLDAKDKVVGHVYHVVTDDTEYVYTEENGWEELGLTVSLEGYATTDEVTTALRDYMKLVPEAGEGKIAIFDANGQVVAGAKTIDELIEQLSYTHPSNTAYVGGFYKVTVDEFGHVTNATAVTIADIDGLGAVAEATKATKDGDGNVITATYATKQELTDSALVWEAI